MNKLTISETSVSPELQKQRIVTANSTALFVLAYLLAHTVYQLATVFMANLAHIPVKWYSGHIDFKIADNQWVKNDVISTYAAGPLASLALAIFFFTWFTITKKNRGITKVFLMWTFIHGLNLFLGSLLAGTIIQGGFWYALQWTVINYQLVWIIAGLFGMVLFFSGTLLAPVFLLSCDSITLMQPENRRKMLRATLVYPWLIGSISMAVVKFPDLQTYEMLQFATLLLFLAPAYLQNLKNPLSQNIEEPQRTRLSWAAVILVLITALAFRILLQNGIFLG